MYVVKCNETDRPSILICFGYFDHCRHMEVSLRALAEYLSLQFHQEYQPIEKRKRRDDEKQE